eukprot:5779030-Pleurochrysis_carterae.AAC.1
MPVGHALRRVPQRPGPRRLPALRARGARGEGTPLARRGAGAGGGGGDTRTARAVPRRCLGGGGRRLATAGRPPARPRR